MNIIELAIEFEYHGQNYYIYPSLIVSGEELTLVDAGYPQFMPRIEDAILKHGHDPQHLQNIIITHYDDDHIGALEDFKLKYPAVTVIASEAEAPFISGKVKSERLVQAEALLAQMSAEDQASGEEFVQLLQDLRHVPVDMTVRDGEWILNNKCQIIATPGHTSGHISLYFPELSSVITGDAAVKEGEVLAVANPQYCLDLESAADSLSRLIDLKAQTYYCYHEGQLRL
ncbi:MBL fold metallo-hydrolase [Paenibacillus sp. MMS20-IR301]|uniref:MBL fold metallo-hydrolase n=1 Tax=Paenibacillus sp. MMS20-IR301 TaxID=2895946 RepID=UPI0028EBEBD8|nr:MBL fold metallo-hydrolase [Paenibacillus sp. MMS20-IR301]WNS44868.1 MBL fold metallo-hydrolase [Paenibacillus sp. MMS20-IR301]